MTMTINELHEKIYWLVEEEKKANPTSFNKEIPYQSYERIEFDGLRWSVEKRVAEYGLGQFFKPDTAVLDIGSNFGFFVAEFALQCGLAHGVEPTPQLNAIGMATAEHLGIPDRVAFFDTPFDAFVNPIQYDTVLSLAAFFTADGRERSSPRSYFKKIKTILKPGGRVFYESTSYTKKPDSEEYSGFLAARGAISAMDDLMILEKEWETPSGSKGYFRSFAIARKDGS